MHYCGSLGDTLAEWKEVLVKQEGAGENVLKTDKVLCKERSVLYRDIYLGLAAEQITSHQASELLELYSLFLASWRASKSAFHQLLFHALCYTGNTFVVLQVSSFYGINISAGITL